MIGKAYYEEPQGSFKVFIKKQVIYCVACQIRTDKKSITPKQVINELITQKSKCVHCGSKKSGFVREYKCFKKKK